MSGKREKENKMWGGENGTGKGKENQERMLRL